MSNFKKKSLAGSLSTCLLASVFSTLPSFALAADFSTEMRNVLTFTGEGAPNPAYGNKIKNIMIFQAGGWQGLLNIKPEIGDPTWPLNFGKAGYLSKSLNTYLIQMDEIQRMNKNTAVAVLLMPDIESTNSGNGACWDGNWNGTACVGGEGWKTPTQLFQLVKWAAWKKGVQVAPLVSINNYGTPDGSSPHLILPKLKAMVTWLRTTTDLTTLKTVEGKIVILTEGLPTLTGLKEEHRKEILAWMGDAAQRDILWIDNLAAEDGNPALMMQYPNIYRSAAVSGAYPAKPSTTGYDPADYVAEGEQKGTWCPQNGAQETLNSLYSARYRWHFADRFGRFQSDMANPNYKVCERLRLRWLNITPHDSKHYPVIISQWNEYSEFHVFEPSVLDVYTEYNYLTWRLSQQP